MSRNINSGFGMLIYEAHINLNITEKSLGIADLIVFPAFCALSCSVRAETDLEGCSDCCFYFHLCPDDQCPCTCV